MISASPTRRSRTLALTAAMGFLALTGCGDVAAPTTPEPDALRTAIADAPTSSRAADRCVNVAAEGTATLGFPITLPNGTTGAGANWLPFAVGGIQGELASVVVSQAASGANGQGALHLELEHAFRTPAGDYFITRDRAVCAPSAGGPAVCRVNDVLTIVGGTGVFAGANGSLRNHGVIDFAAGTLVYAIRGRVCADGL